MRGKSLLLSVVLLSLVLYFSSADGLNRTQLISKLSDLLKQVTALQAEASVLKSNSELQQKELNTLRLKIIELQNRSARLSESLQTSSHTAMQLQVEVQALNQDLETLRTQLRDLSKSYRQDKIKTIVLTAVITAVIAGGTGFIVGIVVQ